MGTGKAQSVGQTQKLTAAPANILLGVIQIHTCNDRDKQSRVPGDVT